MLWKFDKIDDQRLGFVFPFWTSLNSLQKYMLSHHALIHFYNRDFRIIGPFITTQSVELLKINSKKYHKSFTTRKKLSQNNILTWLPKKDETEMMT